MSTDMVLNICSRCCQFDIQITIGKKTHLECSQGYVSADSKQWLCNTCRLAIKKERWPKLSIINGMGFPSVPTELQLSGMEERIICPRLLFFQMRTHFMGGRTQVLGNVVNVPVDVAPTVQTLPRTLSDTETLVVKYKRKLEYKKYPTFCCMESNTLFASK